MTAKLKRAPKLPKTSLLERLDKPSGPDLRPQLSGMETRLMAFEAVQDIHNKDIAWLKAGVEANASDLKSHEASSEAKPSFWPLWTMLIAELAGLAYLAAKLYGYV